MFPEGVSMYLPPSNIASVLHRCRLPTGRVKSAEAELECLPSLESDQIHVRVEKGSHVRSKVPAP
jgi:hypothetical protein